MAKPRFENPTARQQPPPPPEQNTDDNQCLCNVHVHTGAFILGIVGICYHLSEAIVILAVEGSGIAVKVVVVLFQMASAICYLLMLIGNRKYKYKLYWPYFIAYLVQLIVQALAVGAFYIVGTLAMLKQIELDKRQETAVMCLINGSIYVVGLLIQAYIFFVVYRDYRYLNDIFVDESPKPEEAPKA